MKRSKILICLVLLVVLAVASVVMLPYIKRTLYPLKYEQQVTKYSQEYNVPETLVYAIICTESSFDSEATSNVGARGLMQLMPDTFGWIANKLDEPFDESKITDPETNIKYGTYYLSYLYQRFGDWETVMAAYNAGPNKVSSWLSDSKYSDDNISLKEIPYEETRDYVNRVSKAEKQYKEIYYSKED